MELKLNEASEKIINDKQDKEKQLTNVEEKLSKIKERINLLKKSSPKMDEESTIQKKPSVLMNNNLFNSFKFYIISKYISKS